MGTVDAVEQARLVRDGECTAHELVAAAIERIARLDPELNAVIHRRDERALAEAEQCDRAAPEDRARPFRGVPIVVKDTEGSAMAGEPLTLGTRVLRDADWRAPADTPLTRRIREAGFVVVGRTNVPELCASGTTEPVAFGPTRNPGTIRARREGRAVARRRRSPPAWSRSRTGATAADRCGSPRRCAASSG